ncbi:MAG: hypothetical protein LAP87_18415 [Acidobacteriia bacterium]|nr:hypothetical protein [Terriglobia bacterium]
MLDPTTRVAELPDKLGGRLYALIAGYPATFFARVEPGGFELPPDPKLDAFRGRGFALDWSLFYDIRVWGENGEWHAWRDDEWFDRTRMFEDLKDTLDYRDYPILGRHDVREDHGWILRSERRGPQVWVPAEWPKRDVAGKRPVLVVQPIIAAHPDTGLYGVVDSVIRRATWTEGESHE